jgi:glutamate-1-semialdehyde aminotransferase
LWKNLQWGPAICGHNVPEVNAALIETLKKGTSFGAPSYNENVLAKMVIEAVPRFVHTRKFHHTPSKKQQNHMKPT